jgi:hypothetical protein
MTPEQLESRIQDNLDSVNEEFMEKVEESQEELLALLLLLLRNLKYDGDEVANSQENYAAVNGIMQEAERVMGSGKYLEALVFYRDKLEEQFQLIRDYFESIGEQLSPEDIEAIEAQQNSLERSALESLTEINASVYSPIQNALILAIAGAGTRSVLEDSFKEIVVGDSVRKGRLFVFANTLSDTLFTSITRSLVSTFSRVLGFTKFRYAGGLIKDSRDFCVARNGGVYNVDTIRSWADIGTWQGKIPNTTRTTIFFYLGGYRCRHWLIPVR